MPDIIEATALDVIADAIAAAGHGTIATDLFMGLEVDGDISKALGQSIPDECVIVTEGDGIPHLTMGTAVALEAPTVQVLVRGASEDYNGPRFRAMRIRYAVAALRDFESRGLRLLNANPIGSILPLGKDAEGRHRFTVNFQTAADPSYTP